ncbi:MAG: glycosyltransferase family 4 protein, partial [Verrucomicrobiota bacterium]
MGDSAPALLVVSPTPPPMHGAARQTASLLEMPLSARFRFVHINARFVGRVEELQKLTIGKLMRLARYLAQMVAATFRNPVRGAILTPTFLPKPFLKDSLIIWCSRLLGHRYRIAWLHMDFGTLGWDRRSRLFRAYCRATLRACTHVVCVADSLKKGLPDFLRDRHVSAIPNGIVDQHTDLSGQAKPSANGIRILYLSNLSVEKGWRVLLEVAGRLCRRYPEVEFVFHGAPAADSPQAEIEAAFSATAFPERIRYAGFADDEERRRVMAEADVFCFPSFNEAFPLSVLEAMAAGLPIVASRVGGVPDALVDGEGGLLVEKEDPGKLELALERL